VGGLPRPFPERIPHNPLAPAGTAGRKPVASHRVYVPWFHRAISKSLKRNVRPLSRFVWLRCMTFRLVRSLSLAHQPTRHRKDTRNKALKLHTEDIAPMGERSRLQTRTATTKSVSLRRWMKKLMAFLNWNQRFVLSANWFDRRRCYRSFQVLRKNPV